MPSQGTIPPAAASDIELSWAGPNRRLLPLDPALNLLKKNVRRARLARTSVV
jgi:hypothetical protein